MKITKQLLDKKVAQLYYGNKKIVSIIYVNKGEDGLQGISGRYNKRHYID